MPRNVRAPSGLGDVIQKAMAKRPELRFQTAGDMADELGRLSGTIRRRPQAAFSVVTNTAGRPARAARSVRVW